ncbi:DUF7660 family protein [Pseudomonas sp. Eth.TT006]
MSVDLDELLVRVTDEQSFIEFVAALSADFSQERARAKTTPSSHEASASGWENGAVDTFLDAAAAWAMATSRITHADAAVSNVWQRCAEILLAGKFYE